MKLFTYISIIIMLFILPTQHSTLLSQEGDTFMWKVESDSTVVYLLGSIHIAKPDLYPLDERIESAFDKSDNLVVELDISKVNPFTMMKYLQYSDSSTLEDNITSENYKKLADMFEENGMPEIAYSKLRPWAAATTAQLLILRSSGYNESYGIDTHFMNQAREDSIPILELETPEFQLNLMSEFDKVGDSYIEYTMKSTKKTVSDVDNLFEAWKSGNTKELIDYINGPTDEYPEFEEIFEKLVDKRNENMTEKIKEFLNTKDTYFIVVGAGHLVGEAGIIELLMKEDKYKITHY